MNHNQETPTFWLESLGSDPNSPDQLFPIVYKKLRAMAGQALRKHKGCYTLQPTLLVDEAFMNLINQEGVEWRGRAHFYSVAAHAMRQIIIQYARRASSVKRGGNRKRITISPEMAISGGVDVDLLALNEALEKFAVDHPRRAKTVECKFFAGMEEEEVAEVLGVSTRTVRDDWRVARAWLRSMLEDVKG